MKRTNAIFNCTIILILLFVTTIGFAQNSCSKYYPFEEGVTLNYKTYDKKGKDAGALEYGVKTVSETAKGLVAEMSLAFSDKKERIFTTITIK